MCSYLGDLRSPAGFSADLSVLPQCMKMVQMGHNVRLYGKQKK